MELIDYVVNTPQNTNKTILKQLVNSEKNKAVYESVEELKREGGAGYTDPGLVLTWDGDLSGAIDDGTDILVKIHDKYLDLSQAVSVSVNSNVLPDFTETTIPREKLEFFADECVNGFSYSELGGMLGAVSIPVGFEESVGVGEGVYVTAENAQAYISKITFAETVHPIDPKYLPNNVIYIEDHGFKGFEYYFTNAMTQGNGHIADVEVQGFWEKIDKITQNGCGIIWLVDNYGTCVGVFPTHFRRVQNLSSVQWISYLADIDAYAYVKANINRGRSEYGEARLHMWIEVLPKV